MKKRVLLFVSVLILVATPLLAQESKKSINCSGTISDDGQSFVCDKDHKTWKVSNPGVLREMEGHRVKLVYRLTSNSGEIFVTSASMVQDQQQTVAHNPGDAAFRR